MKQGNPLLPALGKWRKDGVEERCVVVMFRYQRLVACW
jgi:hypothetical protein